MWRDHVLVHSTLAHDHGFKSSMDESNEHFPTLGLYTIMQKGVGLGALTRNSRTNQQYALHGERLQKSQIDKLNTQLSVFQAALLEFSRTHAKDIRSNPEFRAEFARMCTAIGVDPLASSSNKKGSFWAEMLGTSVNDFYFELAVRVVEVCRRTRDENGGLIAVAEVKDRIMKLDEKIGGTSDVSEYVGLLTCCPRSMG